jgi:hypothetical protein
MSASFELALKQRGWAGGCTFEMALSGHESGTHPARFQWRITALSGRLCPKWSKSANWPEFGRAGVLDVARWSRATPDNGGAKHFQVLETSRSFYHALIGLATMP